MKGAGLVKSVIINPSKLTGEIRIPPSKSISHRAIICGGLSEGLSNIKNIIFSDLRRNEILWGKGRRYRRRPGVRY